MSTTTRTPTEADLPAILALTRANRALLASLEPHFWRPSANADALHEAFVTYQIANPELIKRVLEKNSEVIGYAVSVAHPAGFYFIDDVCLSPAADWSTDGRVLLTSIAERPALMTAPHRDRARVEAAVAVGLEHIGCVRSLRFDQTPPLPLDPAPVVPMATPPRLPVPPRHVWLPAMRPEAVSVIGDGGDGCAVISAPLDVPPIYDPGGRPSVVDRVIGADRQALLMCALSFAHQRGDVGVILIVDAADAELAGIADRLGARQPVDTFSWPEARLAGDAGLP